MAIDKKACLVFVHGMWSNPNTWSPFSDWFEEKGWEISVPTLPYHNGLTDDLNFIGTQSLLDYIQFLEAELTKIDKPYILIGHSMGGFLVQALAARCDPAATICISPAAPAGVFGIRPTVLRVFSRNMITQLFWKKPIILNWGEARHGLFNNMPETKARKEFDKLIPESGRALFELGFWQIDFKNATTVDARRIKCPMLITGSKKDQITPYSIVKSTAKRYPTAELRTYENNAHFIFLEEGWQTFAQDLEDWMIKIEA